MNRLPRDGRAGSAMKGVDSSHIPVVATNRHPWLRRHNVRPGDDGITQDKCERFIADNPIIAERAPAWARTIEILEILDDGSGIVFYVFKDERFEVIESWHIQPDGSLIYGHNNDDEPEITSYDDSLLELVTDYIERTAS